jgi:hypothetical protein
MSVSAALVVCEDMRFEVSGKFMLIGGYTGNIAIDPSRGVITRLIFLFIMEFDISDALENVTFHVDLPGGVSRAEKANFPNFPDGTENARRIFRQVVFVDNQPPIPGPIIAKIKWDGGEHSVAAPSIVLTPTAATTPAPAAAPIAPSLLSEPPRSVRKKKAPPP